MLNYETILSSYDDKLTLMQWLKKVEDALNNASAVAFKVNKRGDATLTFSVEFEDGSELETGPIVLEQGESVESAAIVNGHLQLTLTNGDVLDAGDLGGISSFSIDGSQHLIVHYQNGTTQDLGAIFNGNINISGNMVVAGDVTAATLNQTQVNWSGEATLSGLVPNITFDNVYCRIQEINGRLDFIFNCELKNETASDISISRDTYIAQRYRGMGSTIASKIYDMEGETLHDAKTIKTIITAAHGYILPLNGASSKDCSLFLFNEQSPDVMYIVLTTNEDVTIPAGEARYATARIQLDLI